MKNKFTLFLSFLGYCGMFFVLSRASLNGLVYPFAYGLLFALAWANQKVWLLAPAFLVGSIANNYSFEGIICSVVAVAVLLIPYYIHIALKKPMQKWELFLYGFISQSAYLVFSILGGQSVLLILAHFILGMAMLWLEVVLFEALVIRGLSNKLTVIELVAGGALVMCFCAGLENCDIYGFSLLKMFTSFMILCLSHISSILNTLIFSALAGIGGMFNANNPLYVAPFMLYAIFACVFKKVNKIFPAVAVALAEVLSTFYFNLYYSSQILSIIPVLVVSVVFVCIPKKLFEQVAMLFNTNYDRMAVKSILNRNREVMQRRLDRLSEVFFEMNLVFKKLIRKNASEEEIKEMLYEELKSTICKGCPDHKHCHRTFNEDTKKIFISLISIALERGRITLLDLPTYLSSRCGKANMLISEINTLTKQYKSYRNLVGSIDTSKLLISDQLEGVAGLMKSLSKEVDCMISVDNNLETKIIEELASNNIICMDAIVYQKDAWTCMATLIVREEDANKIKLPEVTGKLCGCKMCVYDVKQSERAGLVSVNLKTAPAYDCVFGLALTPKGGNSVSGDRHCIERLDGDRFIFAICDGMGHGEEAGEKSDTAISLIENFYKAGFDSEVILSSVNKLLNLEGDDIFSTIDACIVDLKNGVADFVKMGASSSYIRGEDGCQIIENESLPVGIVENAKVKTQKVVLKNKDFIVICSDGINDSFGDDGEFGDFILSLKSANPQEQADKILERALAKNNGYAVDDMTVLVVKIFN
ncbi:MAG: SpoIIE family protein phosphatase [Clostridia bacterium]|nr:SpoIIE family protein phosphatase [Clostridia bacterium]